MEVIKLKRKNVMDEMDRSIQLRSEAIAYKAGILALSLWTIVASYQTLVSKADFQILPVLVLCFATSVQNFSRLAIKNKMIAGDDEYKEPNKFLRFLMLGLVLTALIIFLGTWIFIKG